jgi:hypothetical protein
VAASFRSRWEKLIMRPKLALLALPLAITACGGSEPPPPTPVVINTPPAPAPVMVAPPPTTPAQSSLVTQCQGLFAQALGNQQVSYATPAITSAGGSTTIHLAGQPMLSPSGSPLQYFCTFSGTTLTAAGLN